MKKYFIITLDTPLVIDNKQIWGYRQLMPEFPFTINENCIQEYVEYLVAIDFCERFMETWGIDQTCVPDNRNLYTNLEKTKSLLLPSEYDHGCSTNITIFNHAVFTNYPIHYRVLLNQEIPENEEWVKNEDERFITSEENRNRFRNLYS